MKRNYETYCPLFPGFYGSVFEYDRESEDIEYYNEENGTNLSYDDFNWGYKDYEKRVSIAFVNKLECELKQFLDIAISFQEVVSPKEYNFKNDSINVRVKLDLKELIRLIEERKEFASQYFKYTYTSCSGFISFHSNDIEDWLNIKYINEKPEHRIGALLDCLCSIEIDRDDIIYWADSEGWIDMWPKVEIESSTINAHE
jgi:hypothetical protein